MWCRCSSLDSRSLRPVCEAFTGIISVSLYSLDKAIVDDNMRGTLSEQTLKNGPFGPWTRQNATGYTFCPHTVSVIYNRVHNSLRGNQRTQAGHQQTGDTAAVWHIASSYAGTCLGSCTPGI